MKAIIIIPAYNEEENLVDVVAAISAHCVGIDYVIVNDGSTDGTAELCREKGFNIVNMISNLGFSGAVQTGYKYALEQSYDFAIQFDGDGQHPAESIKKMIEILAYDEADYVLGSRFLDIKKPLSWRMFGSSLLQIAVWLRTGKNIKDPTSGMRAVNQKVFRNMARSLNFIAEPDTLVRAILSGARIQEVQVTMKERINGESHFKNPLNSFKYMVRILASILVFQGRKWS